MHSSRYSWHLQGHSDIFWWWGKDGELKGARGLFCVERLEIWRTIQNYLVWDDSPHALQELKLSCFFGETSRN